jgi:hypothetical protein
MRLTNRIRDQIIERVIDFGFEEKFKAIREEVMALSEETYATLYPPALLDKMNQLEALEYDRDGSYIQKEFYNSQASIRVAYGYRQDQIHFKQKKPVAANRRHFLDTEHPLTIKHEQIAQRQECLTAEHNIVKREIRAILYSVTTFKKLYEVWPEVTQFTADIEVTAAMQLPAVKVDSINSKLGLAHE